VYTFKSNLLLIAWLWTVGRSFKEEWNSATLKVLKQHAMTEKKTNVRAAYKNALAVFKTWENIEGSISGEKTRRELFLEFNPQSTSKIYIIEVISSGERAGLSNYVIKPGQDDHILADVFVFAGRKWHKKESNVKIDIPFNDWLPNMMGQNSDANNTDVVIVTQVVNGKVIRSEFFIAGTLPDKSNIAKFLKTRND